MAGRIVVIAGGAALVMLGVGLALFGMRSSASPARVLVGDDFGAMRREALDLFPRGEPVADVKTALTTLGFRCAPARRLVPNINAPSVECDSAGRGFPDASRIEVTVMARNGALSDIAIGNGLDAAEADARTPDPNPGGNRGRTARP